MEKVTSNFSSVTLRAETASTKSLIPLRSSRREKKASRQIGFSLPIICTGHALLIQAVRHAVRFGGTAHAGMSQCYRLALSHIVPLYERMICD